MRKARRFISRQKQDFLVSFSLTFPRFPRVSKNRLSTSLTHLKLYNWMLQRQKQLSRCVLRKRCSENTQLIYTPVPKCNFNIKVLWNFIEIALRHECSSVNLQRIFRTPFYQNTFEGLFLKKKVQKVQAQQEIVRRKPTTVKAVEKEMLKTDTDVIIMKA